MTLSLFFSNPCTVQVSVSTPEGERTSVTSNRLRGYPNLRQDTNISGNMGTPGYPILRDTHISVTPGSTACVPQTLLFPELREGHEGLALETN